MGKNYLGGKKRKKGKNNLIIKIDTILFKDDSQEYALVTKVLGGGKFLATANQNKEYMCIIRGAMRKRVWISIGDLILIEPRYFENKNVADIIHKYTSKEHEYLIKKKLFIINTNLESDSMEISDEDLGFTFDCL